MSHNLFLKYPELKECKESIDCALELIANTFKSDSKLLLCGNGGSSSDCDHISGELLKSFKLKRALDKKNIEILGANLANNLQGSLPTIPLTAFTGFITAYSNDCDPIYAYSQLVWGLGNQGDTLLGISTSGNSKNVLNAIKVANKTGIKTIGLTGKDGGELKSLCECIIRVPSDETYEIQEYHLPIYHHLCIELEYMFFDK